MPTTNNFTKSQVVVIPTNAADVAIWVLRRATLLAWAYLLGLLFFEVWTSIFVVLTILVLSDAFPTDHRLAEVQRTGEDAG